MADDLSSLDQPADFRRQGRDLALGADDAGVAAKHATLYERAAINTVGRITATIKESIDDLLDWVGTALEQFEDKAALIFTPIMARLVGHALGVDVSSAAIRERMDRSGDGAIGKVVAETVFEVLKPRDEALEPGDAPARRVIGAIGHMTINNWAEGLTLEWLAEYLGWDIHLEALPHLATELIGNLGLNELASRALRPYANIAIRTPLTWKLNKQYRPKMLDASAAAAAWLRGDIPEETFLEICRRDGYGEDAIAAIVSATRKNFTPADAYLLVQLALKDKDWAIAQLRSSGMDAAEAEDWFHLQEAKSLRTYQLEAAQSAVTAYGNRLIDDITLAKEIDQLGLDQTTLDRFHAEALRRRRLNVQRLRRADVEAAIELDILSVSDYDDWLEANGYSHEDALTLQLVLLAKLQRLEDARTARSRAAAAREAAKAAKLQEQRAARDRVVAEHAHWTGTLGEAERLVVRNIMPPNQYRQVLIDHGLSPGDADALTVVATQDRDDRLAAAQKRLAAAAKTSTPIVSLQLLERGVVLGKRSIEDFRAELARRNYADADVQLLVALLQQDIADRTAAQAKRDAAAAALQVRAISLAQLETAVLAGERPIDEYRQLLEREKYSSADVATLVALLEQKVKDRALADERHRLAEQRLAASHLTLTDEEKAVVEGIVTLDDYTLYLEAHGFDVDDQAVLTALLETKIEKKSGGA